MSVPQATSTGADAKLDLGRILDTLQAQYGELTPHSPTDPYLFLVWWQCG